eukprot:s4968_g3.t1
MDAVVKTLLERPDEVDKSQLSTELTFTAKLRELFPHLPDEVMMRVVPYLGMMQSLLIMAEEVRNPDALATQFVLEQPEDLARYRSPDDVQRHGYFSVFRTAEWRAFAEAYNLQQYHFDQFPFGHTKRKAICLATHDPTLGQLNDVRGGPENESQLSDQFRSLPVYHRCEVSRTWSAWAPGLKEAISKAVSQRIQRHERDPDSVQP